MNRRSVIGTLALSSMVFALPHFPEPLQKRKGSFSMDGNKIRFSHPDIEQTFDLTMIADTHLFRDDHRGDAFKPFSDRMSKAYNQTKHFQTGKEINPEIGFEETLRIAQEQQSKLVALIGDIFSFPSEAAIDWALDKMNKTGLPYVYTAGNHDWHYEGMKGSSEQLRETWIKNRLSPLYQGRDPLMHKVAMHGVNIIVLDNSTYEINDAQLKFLKDSLADQRPSVLMVHIPLYATGRPVSFGCGHPQWGARSDKNFTLERRQPWRENGHTPTTMEFYETVFKSNNLLGVLAGHIHNQSVDIINGIPQIVTESNAEGGYLQVSFLKA